MLAIVCAIYYAGFRGGVQSEEVKILKDQNAAATKFFNEFQLLDSAYAGQLQQLPVSDTDTGPAVTAAISLPIPSSKPSRPALPTPK